MVNIFTITRLLSLGHPCRCMHMQTSPLFNIPRGRRPGQDSNSQPSGYEVLSIRPTAPLKLYPPLPLTTYSLGLPYQEVEVISQHRLPAVQSVIACLYLSIIVCNGISGVIDLLADMDGQHLYNYQITLAWSPMQMHAYANLTPV